MTQVAAFDIPEVQGAYVFTPSKFTDHRGFFQEHFNSDKYAGKVGDIKQISLCMQERSAD